MFLSAAMAGTPTSTSGCDDLAAFERLRKAELHQLADRLARDDAEAIEICVAFLEAETRGHWHGRGRAMMARRLKHCPLSLQQQLRLLRAILQRLTTGCFAEQFKDQLRLALRLDPAQVFAIARSCLDHPKDYVRRYAAWILLHPNKQDDTPRVACH
jgi:hypothetical protein